MTEAYSPAASKAAGWKNAVGRPTPVDPFQNPLLQLMGGGLRRGKKAVGWLQLAAGLNEPPVGVLSK